MAYTADKCLPGGIQREFQSRLQIFITWCTHSATEGARGRERVKGTEKNRGKKWPETEKKIAIGFG